MRDTALALAVLMAMSPAVADEPSIRLTAPAWMLSTDNPLRRARREASAIEVDLPGRAYHPPLSVPQRPRGPQAPAARAAVTEILAGLRAELGIADPVTLHAEARYRDAILAFAFVQGETPDWRVFVLVNRPEGGWRHDEHALGEPLIEAVAAAWDENGWITVVPEAVIAARN